MGQYSELHIGDFYYSWKNYIPSYLGLIFEKEDYYSEWDESEDCYAGIGYHTTYEKALLKLDTLGFTIDFLAEIYEFFYDDLFEEYAAHTKLKVKESLERTNLDTSEKVVEEKFWEHIGKQLKKSRYEELQDFVSYIRTMLRADFKNPTDSEAPFIKLHGKFKEFPPRTYEIKSNMTPTSIDLEEWSSYLFQNPFSTPHSISMFVSLFEGAINDFPEIVTLMFLRIVLEASDDIKGDVVLELSDIIESEEDAKSLLDGLNMYLVNKISLYNRFFQRLFLTEKDIKSNYIKAQSKELLSKTTQTTSVYEKGKILEDLIGILFTVDGMLDLVDKRVSTGDEEIDLVVKNNIDRPFWLAFNSPLFFIECKNWNKPVGVSEVRNFEVKLMNHSSLVKIGFFISVNGFSKDAITELKRLGRDHYHIVFIDGRDIENYVNSRQDFFTWLEKKVSQVI